MIGVEALDVYNAFTWDSDEDKVKMDKVLEHFEQYCEPRKNTIYERYLFFSRGQESGEPIDKYATVLRKMADSCKFQDLKDSLIRDRIVFGIADNNVRERLLRVPDLTLNKALEIARAAEATQSQLKQMQNLHEVNAVEKKKEKFTERNKKRRRNQQTEVLSRSTASFVAGNMYQTDHNTLHMANSATSVEKATILLRSVQEEGSPVVIYMPIRI